MAIIGHGVDVVDLPRMERLLGKDEDAFVGWFSLRELSEYSQNVDRVRYVSGRIAAKEAVAKALGTGFSTAVSWQDIQITTPPPGSPCVELSGGAKEAARKAGVSRILVSISHSQSIAIASAIALDD